MWPGMVQRCSAVSAYYYWRLMVAPNATVGGIIGPERSR